MARGSEARKCIVVDAGPLLLHAVGFYVSIARYRREALEKVGFNEPAMEYRATDLYLRSMEEVWVTPHVLAEVSATARRKLRLRPYETRVMLSCYRQFLTKCNEQTIARTEILRDPDIGLGIGDVSVLRLAERRGVPLFSTDTDLMEACAQRNVDVRTLGQLMSRLPRPSG